MDAFRDIVVMLRQACGNYFLTGGSKSRGPHFEDNQNTLLDLVSEYNIIMM